MLHAIAGFVLLGVVASAPGAAAAADDPDYPRLFGTREVRSANLAPFPKWTEMLERYVEEVALADESCAETLFTLCDLRGWKKLLDGLRGADPTTQLAQLNRYVNRLPYISDRRNYDSTDYWATPRQFLDRGGDCEDYAIAKYMSLRALGWKMEHLRIVVVQDLNLGIVHAVLVAYHDDEAWVLDNEIKPVIAADRIVHYRPYFSINENGWWLHKT